jgi:hypothetical protein
MTDEEGFKEDRLVVEPLMRWFKEQNEGWSLHKPSYRTSARGWDIEARREDQEDLLIEAKYIGGPAIPSLAGLVAAPLAIRAGYFPPRNWPEKVCWAIGIKPPRHMCQILFDYVARNQKFWTHYGEDLGMKYIFFVQDGDVTRIPFATFLGMTKHYADRARDKSLSTRREIAAELSVCLKRPDPVNRGAR